MSPERTTYTLLALTQSIQQAIAGKFVSAYWVKAEMNKLNHYSQSGHCFPELLEKQQGKVVAQMRATLWRDDYRRINQQFIDTMGQPITDGIKILLLARVIFDPVYGMTLRIMDIDPTYTLGDIEREKQETIQKLHEEGLFDRNKQLPFPLLPKRLAIISVESSKGLADFREIIDKNPFGYRFFCMLFPSLLQGDKAVGTLVGQLNRIKKVQSHFDAAAIIRGGGDEVGLSCFNHYRLAKAIATYPLPVLSGIGHSTNETVTEMVTHYNAITPTKLAEFLIQAFHDYAEPLKIAEEVLRSIPLQILRNEHAKLDPISRQTGKSISNRLLIMKQFIQNQSLKVKREVHHRSRHEAFLLEKFVTQLKHLPSRQIDLNKQKLSLHSITLTEKTPRIWMRQHELLINQKRMVDQLDPVNTLKRGYSITTYNGKSITDADNIQPGDKLHIRLYKGVIKSIVESTEKQS